MVGYKAHPTIHLGLPTHETVILGDDMRVVRRCGREVVEHRHEPSDARFSNSLAVSSLGRM